MSIDTLKTALPEYAKDLKLNLGSLATEPGLTDQQRAGTFIASAIASRNADVIRAIVGEFGPKLSPDGSAPSAPSCSVTSTRPFFCFFVFVYVGGGADAELRARVKRVARALQRRLQIRSCTRGAAVQHQVARRGAQKKARTSTSSPKLSGSIFFWGASLAQRSRPAR